MVCRPSCQLYRVFQSTPPHGRRLGAGSVARPVMIYFNPRLRMGGDVPSPCQLRPSSCVFQSTPPHGRRRRRCRAIAGRYHISIHASAWEATRRMQSGDFNPRLRMGGDCPADQLQFQSTPPHGRRLGGCDLIARQYLTISIHASAWEATRRIALHAFERQSVFQSTPPHGRRPAGCRVLHGWASAIFQSTPPHGRRPLSTVALAANSS